MKTEAQLKRMKAMDLAKYADRVLSLPESHVWHREGGPLPKQVLIRAIIEAQQNRQ